MFDSRLPAIIDSKGTRVNGGERRTDSVARNPVLDPFM